MYIIVTIIIIVITTEIYSILKGLIPHSRIEAPIHVRLKKNEGLFLFDEYNVKDDKIIKHFPGKLTINDDYNLFITTEFHNLLVKKNQIYIIDIPFSLEIVNISNKNILYKYIKDE